MTRHIALVYARISQARDGRETSPEVQITRCLRLALERGRTVIPERDIYADRDKGSHSAYTRENIPAWNRLEERALVDPEVAEIIIDTLDRGWRNTRVLFNFEAKCKEIGVKLVFVDSGEVETDSPTGMLQFGMKGLFAEMQSRDTSYRERTRHYDPLRSRGVYLAHRPLPGLKRLGGRLDVRFEAGPDLPLVIELFNLYLQDYGLPAAAKELVKRGIARGNWSGVNSKLARILRGVDAGAYDGIVEPSLLATVKREHKRRSDEERRSRRPKRTAIPFLWQLIVCGVCGRKFTTSTARYPWGEREQLNFRHQTPRDCGGAKNISSRKANKQAFLWLAQLRLFTSDQLDALARQLAAPQADSSDIDVQIAKLEQRLRGYEQMRADGDISRDRWKELKAEIDGEIKELGKRKSESGNGMRWTYKGARLFLNDIVGTDWSGLAASDPERANRLLRSFVARAVLGQDRQLTFELYPILGMLIPPQAGV